MKLTDEVKGYWKIFRNECDLMLRKGGLREAVATEQIPMVDAVLEAFDTIEALQQEVKGWEQRYDELDAGHSRLFKAFCGLKQENEQLQTQAQELAKAKAEGRISPVKCPCDASEEAKELMDAKEEGRLVELPCNVGDTVWLAMSGQIREYIFMGITQQYGYLPSLYGRQRFGKYEDVGIALVDSIGKTVFLTKEAAKKAIAGVGESD